MKIIMLLSFIQPMWQILSKIGLRGVQLQNLSGHQPIGQHAGCQELGDACPTQNQYPNYNTGFPFYSSREKMDTGEGMFSVWQRMFRHNNCNPNSESIACMYMTHILRLLLKSVDLFHSNSLFVFNKAYTSMSRNSLAVIFHGLQLQKLQ